MNSFDALEAAIQKFEEAGENFSSASLKEEGLRILEENRRMKKKMGEIDSLHRGCAGGASRKNRGRGAPESPLESLFSSTSIEFLGEEFWFSLKNREEKRIVNEVYERIRKRLES